MDDQTPERLELFLRDWLHANPYWAYAYGSAYRPAELRTAEAVARELLGAAANGELRFAAFLQSPDGRLVEAVVAHLMPMPERAEFRLLVDAVQIAAKAKTRDERILAGFASIVFAGLLLVSGFGS